MNKAPMIIIIAIDMIIAADDNFCPKCGARKPAAPAKWICPKCGKENDADANFCGKCGERKPE